MVWQSQHGRTKYLKPCWTINIAQVLSVYQKVLWESTVTRNLRNSEISAPKQIESMVQAWPCQSTQSLGWLFADNFMECENFSTFNQKTVILPVAHHPFWQSRSLPSWYLSLMEGNRWGKYEGNDGQTWFTWVVFGVMKLKLAIAFTHEPMSWRNHGQTFLTT